MAEIDWNALQVEYVTGKLSLKKLAAKYGISENTLENRSRKERWSEQRRKYNGKVTAKAVARAGARETRRLRSLQSSASKMCTQIEKLMKDAEKQLFTHVAVVGMGDGVSQIEAVQLEVVDDKKLLNLTKAMKEATGVMRDLYGISTAAQKAQMEMAREELELKKRAQAAKEKAGEPVEGIDVVFKDDELEEYTE